jgi:hypothetical protein
MLATIQSKTIRYGCETWSLTLREKYRLRVLGIFGTKRDEVTGGLEKTA